MGCRILRNLVSSRGDQPCVRRRASGYSTMNAPGVVAYPDSGKVGVINRPPGSAGDEDELAAWFRLEDQVDSWD